MQCQLECVLSDGITKGVPSENRCCGLHFSFSSAVRDTVFDFFSI